LKRLKTHDIRPRAERSAPASLRITARRSGLDPTKWLADVLRRIPTATTPNLHKLLPGNGKPATA